MGKSLVSTIREDVQWGVRMTALASLCVAFAMPVVFALFDDDQVRMSDDYAAVNAAASLGILLIGVVDMHFNVSRAKELAATAAGRLDAVAGRTLRRTYTYEDLIRTHVDGLGNWLFCCAVQTLSLGLVGLWAAIEDHGPARWLAWLSLCSACYGLATVLLTALFKLRDGILGLFELLPNDEEQEPPQEPVQRPNAPAGA
ncbi:hypothetical protein [Streptomyces sp. NPDC090994]|uniref:hypothetical protein n=1 Tax=Streptomyces sp. NPDC090994 TaxID=3365969 RepID=UPI00380BB5B1